jgi:uncharacterized protein
MRRVLILAALTMISGSGFAQVQDQVTTRRPQRIIDMHFHIWEALSAPAESGKAREAPQAPRASSEQLQRAFDRYNVEKVVVSGPLILVQGLVRNAPARLIGGPAFTESISLPSIPVLREEYRAGRLGVLGEIDAQYAGVDPSEAWLDPYWALSEELDIPVMIHTGFAQPGTPYERCCPQFRTRLGNPQLLEPVLIAHRRLRVYLCHAGWPYLAETKAIMQMYPQVYADLSGFAFNPGIPREEFHDYLQALIRAGFGKRLMFGSGLSPKDWPTDIDAALKPIESAVFLTPEQKEDIFYNNAARFLRLKNRDSLLEQNR